MRARRDSCPRAFVETGAPTHTTGPEELQVMKSATESKRHLQKVLSNVAVSLAIGGGCMLAATPTIASDLGCQNQAKIDVCKAGCTATSEVCGALCDFTSGACWVGCQTAFGTCEAGCFTCDGACEICCADPTGICGCGSCRDDCDDCHDDCDDVRDDCEDGCRLDCDECILDCEDDCESICRPFKTIGESCVPLVDRCADGLTCWPFLFQCFPSENDNLYSDEDCRSLYSSGIHEDAIDGNVTWSFGTGGASAVGVSETLETGNVYGQDGRYGCYFTICLGGTTDVEAGLFAATGIYLTYDDFQGESVAFVEEAGEVVVFATSQIINTSGDLIGTADALSIELSLLPVAAGVYDCTTIVNTVGIRQPDGSLLPVNNSPPVAICHDQVACADPQTCVAEVSVDGGSVDPDNDPIVLTQDPPGPYGLGVRNVTLTVSDLSGASDSCTRTVQVNDCTPPDITCPPSLDVQCEADGETFLDPGDADVFDCTEVTITDHEPQAFPLGTTTLTYSAEDAVGLRSSCEQTITVWDYDADGDGVADCADQCPFVFGTSPVGCWRVELPFYDEDGDGVTDYDDLCLGTPEGAPVDEVGCPVEQPVPDDEDGDGVPDDLDACPATPTNEPADADGCPTTEPTVDTDGDGVADPLDLCVDTPAGTEVDAVGCPADEPPVQPAPDSDGDGVPDDLDLCPDASSAVVDADGCPLNEDDGQPGPGDDATVETPCGALGLSVLLMLGMGFAGLRYIPARRRMHRRHP